MAINEEDRLALRVALTDTIGGRETRVLMKALPPVDYDELATKADLDNTRIQIDAELKTLRAETQTEFAAIRTDMASQLRILVMTHIASVIGVAAAVATLS